MNTLLLIGIAMFFGAKSFGVMQLVAMCCLMVVVMLVQLIWQQEQMCYVPCPVPGIRRCRDNPQGYRSPREKGLDYEDVHLKAEDGVRVHAWFIPARPEVSQAGQEEELKKPAGTVLFCHANAGNIGMRLPNFERLVTRMRLNVFAFDYRGYGESEGEPSEEGIMRDAAAAWEWLEKAAADGTAGKHQVDGSRLFIFGRSLGGAVAVSLSRRLQRRAKESPEALPPWACGPCGVMLENIFCSMYDLVDDLLPMLAWFPYLKRKFLRLDWNNLERIQDLEVPLLFLSGAKDEMVPPLHTRRLHEAAKASRLKRLVSFPTGMHNDTWDKGGADYVQAMQQFISHCGLMTAMPES